MHLIFYLFLDFPPLFIETPAIAGSSAPTRNMQQGLSLELCPFCSERRHFPWGEDAVLGVWKAGHHHIAGQELKATGSCQPFTCPWAGQGGCGIKLLEAPLPVSPWPFGWTWALGRCCWRSGFPCFPLTGRERAKALNCLQKTRRASQ